MNRSATLGSQTMSPAELETFFKPAVRHGRVRVASDWDQSRAIANFINGSHLVGNWDSRVDDKHFKQPTRVLRPNDSFDLDLYAIRDLRRMPTLQEQVDFLMSKHAQFAGVQGLTLVAGQKQSIFASGMRLIMLDNTERLYKDGAEHLAPSMEIQKGKIDLNLRDAETPLDEEHFLVCLSSR